MAVQNIVGIFESVTAARAARTALLDAGIPQDRIMLSADLTADPVAGEAPGQSYENQPGQSSQNSAAAPYSEAVRSGGCVLNVKTQSQADGKRVEKLLRDQGARRTTGYREVESPERPDAGDADNRKSPAPPPNPSPGQDATEQSRIAFLVQRDGEEAARVWVERTLKLYREAIATKGHAAQPDYRPLFEDSIRVFERWLHAKQPSG